MNEFNIILTIPHAVSDPYTEDRTYDISALLMAKILEALLKEYFNVFIIKSHQNRYILDDNRYINRKNNLTILNDSKLWKDLRDIFNSIDYRKTILIDCHSFYKGGFKEDESIEVVILDYAPYQSLVYELINKIPNSERMNGLIGSNSIMDIFRIHPHSIPVILLEVREDLSHQRLYKIANNIKDVLINYIKYMNNKTNYVNLSKN